MAERIAHRGTQTLLTEAPKRDEDNRHQIVTKIRRSQGRSTLQTCLPLLPLPPHKLAPEAEVRVGSRDRSSKWKVGKGFAAEERSR